MDVRPLHEITSMPGGGGPKSQDDLMFPNNIDSLGGGVAGGEKKYDEVGMNLKLQEY